MTTSLSPGHRRFRLRVGRARTSGGEGSRYQARAPVSRELRQCHKPPTHSIIPQHHRHSARRTHRLQLQAVGSRPRRRWLGNQRISRQPSRRAAQTQPVFTARSLPSRRGQLRWESLVHGPYPPPRARELHRAIEEPQVQSVGQQDQLSRRGMRASVSKVARVTVMLKATPRPRRWTCWTVWTTGRRWGDGRLCSQAWRGETFIEQQDIRKHWLFVPEVLTGRASGEAHTHTSPSIHSLMPSPPPRGNVRGVVPTVTRASADSRVKGPLGRGCEPLGSLSTGTCPVPRPVARGSRPFRTSVGRRSLLPPVACLGKAD